MKKVVRLLGVSLVVAMVFTSCTSDGSGDSGGGKPIVTNSILPGRYEILGAAVDVSVDLNKDGKKDNDLVEEGYDLCNMDNIILIDNTKFSVIKKGMTCTSSEVDEVYQYKLDEIN